MNDRLMNRPRAVLAVLCLSVVAPGLGEVHASTFVTLSEEELIRGADAIVLGEATGVSYSTDPLTGLAYSHVSFRVSEWMAGTERLERITIVQPGGLSEGVVHWLPGFPAFEPHEEAVLFLRRTRRGFDVFGHFQGKLRVIREGSLPKVFGEGIPQGASLLPPGSRPPFSEPIPLRLLMRRVRVERSAAEK